MNRREAGKARVWYFRLYSDGRWSATSCRPADPTARPVASTASPGLTRPSSGRASSATDRSGRDSSFRTIHSSRAGETALNVSVRVDTAACRYVRFLSLADGWSDSVYIPGLKGKKGMMIIIR